MKVISKFVILAIVFIFVGCASSTDPSAPDPVSVSNSANYSSPGSTVRIADRYVEDSQLPYFKNECEHGKMSACYNVGNYYYQRKQYKTAIEIYNKICSTNLVPRNLPSCAKMAMMFEMGQGVIANQNTAYDIYTRSCYSGDTPSCSDMRRIAKLLGKQI